MSDYINKNDVENYKEIVANIESIDKCFSIFIDSIIRQIYSSFEKNIENLLDEIILNRKNINDNNLSLNDYAFKQIKYIENAIKIIESSKFENVNLFQAFDGIKRNLIDKKQRYVEISKIDKNNIDKLYEAKQFLNNSINYYMLKFVNNENVYVLDCFETLKENEINQLVRVLSRINLDINKADLENIYNVYKSVIVDLEQKSNDLKINDVSKFIIQDRRSTNEVLDLLSNFELSFVAYPESDIMAIRAISKAVLEINQETEKEFDIISSEESEELLKIRIMSINSFKNIVEKNSLEIISDQNTFMMFTNLVNDIDKLILELNILITKNIIENKKLEISLDEITLAKFLIRSYGEIINEVNNISLGENILAKSKDIVNGIKETVAIKKDNLIENKNEIEEAFLSNAVTLKEIEFNKIKQVIFEYTKFDSILFVEKINKILKDDYQEDILEIVIDEKLKKDLATFKKDSILQEISSFEEIMNYSVKSLEIDEHNDMKAFVSFMKNANKDILDELNKYNIEIIYPKQGDKFDAKEHFVLLAEMSSEFKKGEIIKVINSGFKEDDFVIIKANVVCAK